MLHGESGARVGRGRELVQRVVEFRFHAATVARVNHPPKKKDAVDAQNVSDRRFLGEIGGCTRTTTARGGRSIVGQRVGEERIIGRVTDGSRRRGRLDLRGGKGRWRCRRGWACDSASSARRRGRYRCFNRYSRSKPRRDRRGRSQTGTAATGRLLRLSACFGVTVGFAPPQNVASSSSS